MKTVIKALATAVVAATLYQCNSIENIAPQSSQTTIDIAQASSQLASGTSFHIYGSSTYDANVSFGGININGRQGGPKHGRHNGLLDGLSLLAPTEELLAIVEAESAGDMRGFRMAKMGGAKITHYDADGKVIELPMPEDGPHGGSFSGKQFPDLDSILSKIVKTVVDFGGGTTFQRDSVTITRSGKITVNRTGTETSKTETITFDNYSVNGNKIEGIKTRTATFDKVTGKGSVNSSVANGLITFKNGSVGIWTSIKSRSSEIQFSPVTKRPIGGTITTQVAAKVTLQDGSVIYAHESVEPLIEKINCAGRKKAPVSGVVKTKYLDQELVVDFGKGSCEKMSVTVTLNGVLVERPIRN